MTRAEIRAYVRTLINEASPGFWSDAELNTALDRANDRVNALIQSLDEDYFTKSSTFSTVANAKSYGLPSDFVTFRRLEHYSTTDASDIEKIDVIVFPRTEAQGYWPTTTTQRPARAILRGSQLDLMPIPDAVYTLRLYYEYAPPALTSDGISPASPADYHDMLGLWAAILARQKSEDDVSTLGQLYKAREADLIAVMERRRAADPVYAEGFLEGRF